MSKNVLNFFTLMLLAFIGGNLQAQCGDTTASFCYDSNQDDTTVQYSACPDAGEVLNIEFTGGTIEAGWDLLNVFSGTNQDATDALLSGGIDGDLAGMTFSSANAGDCLTFTVISDVSASCAAGSFGAAEFKQSCDPIVCGCDDPTATNFDATANFVGPCTYASDVVHVGTGTQTATSCGGRFIDSGNVFANYSSGESGETILCPLDPANEVIEVIFTDFSVATNWDGLSIFDADSQDPAAQILSANTALGANPGAFSGTESPGTVMALNPTGCLTFAFESDGDVATGNWLADFSCVARPMCNIPINLAASDILFDGATLSWDSNNADFANHTWDVEYGPAGFAVGTGTIIAGLTATTTDITGLTANTDFEFYVTENCDGLDGTSGIGGPAAFTTAPDFCSGDQFTDNGGVGASYSANSAEETVICPSGDPACEKVTVTFNTFQIEGGAGWDGLFIYDADSQDPAAFIDGGGLAGPGGLPAGSFQGTNNPGTITATNATGCLTFFFSSDSSVHLPGWDADVVCSIPAVLTNDLTTITDPCYLPLAPTIFDPCTCNVPTELTDGVVTTLGNFNEELDLVSVAPGSVWTVTAGTGLTVTGLTGGDVWVDNDADLMLSTGDTVTDTDGDGFIQVLGTHDDAVGYDVSLTDGTFSLDIANLCSQPRPTVTDLSATYCTNGIPLTLEAIDALGSTEESVIFDILGPTTVTGATELDPAALAAGSYTLQVTFNGDDTPSTDTPTDVGCPSVSNFSFDILEAPGAIVCNDGVNISLDDNCSATLLADHMLEGADGCDPSYEVQVMSSLGASLGNVVDGSYIGTEWTVRVVELSSGNYCWGSITVEDKIAPTIDCQPYSLACTDDADPNDTTPRPFTLTQGAPAGAAFGANVDTDFTFDVDVPGTPTISDLNFIINVTHPSIDDLDILLTSPAGTVLSLWNNSIFNFNVCGHTGINIILDDESAGADLTCAQLLSGASISGSAVLGFDDVATLEGEDLNGTWTITVQNAGGIAGLVNELAISSPYTATAAEVFTPTAADNCGVVSTEFVDSYEEGDCAGPAATITRTWTVTDASGNSAQCEQLITFDRPDIADVVIPADVTIDCAAYDADASVVDANAAGAGYPSLDGNPIENGSICNITATQVGDDVIIEDICEGSFKIRRKWLVIDWCTGDEREENQLIKVLDTTGPALEGGADQVADHIPATTADNNPLDAEHAICEGCVTLPALDWTDDCSSVVSYTTAVFDATGTLLASEDSNGGLFCDIPLYSPLTNQPSYTVVYTAADGCGNSTTHTETFTTEDQVSPTCVADEITQVSIGNTGEAVVNAETFDDGSYDNCTDVHFLVDKQAFAGDDDAYASFRFYETTETFTCADVDSDIMTFFLVMDDWMWNEIQATLAFGSFSFNSANLDTYAGHFNICMVQTLVEDKLDPFKVEDVEAGLEIDCINFQQNFQPTLDILIAANGGNTTVSGTYPNNLGDASPAILTEAFGDVSYDDNCSVSYNVSWSYTIDGCGDGSITRSWTNVSDESGNDAPSCSQTIEIFGTSDWSVSFPADDEVDCGDSDVPVFTTQDILDNRINSAGCELIAVSMDVERFTTVPGACYVDVYTWTVIDWCTYELGTEDIEGTTTDGIEIGYTEIRVIDNDAPMIDISNVQTFFCIGEDLDANTNDNDDEPCTLDISLTDAVVTDCVGEDNVTVTHSILSNGTTGLNHNNMELGDYTVEVTAIDACGNTSVMEYTITVADCKAPTPYCVGSLIVELMPIDNNGDGQPDAGMVELWASDFDVASQDNCTDVELLMTNNIPVTFNADGSVAIPSQADANWEFTCADLVPNAPGETGVGEGHLQTIQLYVVDAYDNVDVCETTLYLETVDNVCGDNVEGPDELNIAGAVATENNASVAGVTVELNNNSTATTSDANGMYNLNATTGSDVTVTPMYDVYDNSVTTYDLVIIRQHILTTSLLDSPYKVIAADINNSGTITGSDLVAAKQVILGMASGYPNNNAWTFVDADYTFAADWNLLTDGYPAVTSINNIAQDEIADFVAVRIGDVNGTYGFADDADERNSFIINANDAKLAAGQEFTVEFTSADYAALGYQFTLNFSNLEVVAVDGNTEDFGIFANAITTSFNGEKEGDKLFAVTFKATSNLTVSEALTLTSNITKAEAYNTNGAAMPVVLEFNNSNDNEFALYQNSPNPFAGRTVVGFSLPTASAATLTITDISGKVLSVVEGDYTKGYNEVSISNLDATGVLYYQLDTPTNSAVRKMVVID